MFGGQVTDGRMGPGMPRVAVLLPQTYMNESGRAAGPARGQYKLGLDQIVVVHDEIDLPFGEVRTRKGGGVAGHNGLKSIKEGLGGSDFWRVRVGVGRPDSTDPEIVSAHVLGGSRSRRVDRAGCRRRSGCANTTLIPSIAPRGGSRQRMSLACAAANAHARNDSHAR